MRQLYSVRKESLGDDVQPGEEGQPWSQTELMTWLWRALPKSFSANSDRMAKPAGIIFEPGKLHRAKIVSSVGREHRYGRNKNSPPNLVRKCRGEKSSWRTSAGSATVGRG